jgi:hypothetical protein
MCAIMARWSDADDYYHARLDVGQGNIKLYKTVGGVVTEIGTAARSLGYNTYYRLRLVAVGTALSVYFANENTAAIAASDASLTTGVYGGIRTYAAAASAVWFDNFTAVPITGAWTRWEETDSRIVRGPDIWSWSEGTTPGASGGGYLSSSTTGATLTLTFTGTGIKWRSALDECSGQATVTLDGVDYVVDNYRSPNQGWQSVAWELSGLAPTSHTFRITVLGTKQAASCGPWIYFDAVDILP